MRSGHSGQNSESDKRAIEQIAQKIRINSNLYRIPKAKNALLIMTVSEQLIELLYLMG